MKYWNRNLILWIDILHLYTALESNINLPQTSELLLFIRFTISSYVHRCTQIDVCRYFDTRRLQTSLMAELNIFQRNEKYDKLAKTIQNLQIFKLFNSEQIFLLIFFCKIFASKWAACSLYLARLTLTTRVVMENNQWSDSDEIIEPVEISRDVWPVISQSDALVCPFGQSEVSKAQETSSTD